MRIKLFLLFFWFLSAPKPGATAFGSRPQPVFDRKEYYDVLKAGVLSAIDGQMKRSEEIGGNDGQAYSGALLMRKAGLLKLPAEKLKAFKKGRIALETAIQADTGRVEYHFLRLIIQEHAPGIVKYRGQLQADKESIRQHFSSLPADLQLAIKDYSRNSTIIHPTDL